MMAGFADSLRAIMTWNVAQRSRFGLLAIDEVESEIGTCDM